MRVRDSARLLRLPQAPPFLSLTLLLSHLLPVFVHWPGRGTGCRQAGGAGDLGGLLELRRRLEPGVGEPDGPAVFIWHNAEDPVIVIISFIITNSISSCLQGILSFWLMTTI